MPSERFYVDTPLKTSEITIEGEEFHHLVRVMRAQVGDAVELINGRRELAQATLQTLGKKEAVLKITSCQTMQKGAEIVLAQAIPRMNHLEWIIEKGTELGASAFWLFPGDHSDKKTLSAHQEARLKALSIAAMKQCGSLFLPSIIMKPPLAAWTPLAGSLFYGDVRQNAPKLPYAPKEPIVIFIGPEKGFSLKEVESLEHKLKAQGVKLHENILRTETAGVVALAQLYTVTLPQT